MVRSSPPDDFLRSWLYMGGAIAAIAFSLAVARILVPLLPIVVPTAGGWWAWRRYQRQQRQQQEALDGMFYNLLRQHQGRVMVLDFAIAAQLSAVVAQQYLDAKAREFAARYEVTQTGDIFYVFPTLQLPEAEFQDAVLTAISDRLPLTQTQLAKRFGVAPDTIRRRKTLGDWTIWSQTKDPAGIAWTYLPDQQRFVAADGQSVAPADALHNAKPPGQIAGRND